MEEADPRPEYRCLMCTKPYNEPRELPCGHTFCWQCLASYIEAEHVTADADRNYFPCPVCDAPSTPGDINTAVSTWASCFPINKLFLVPTSQSVDVHFCAPCLGGEESSRAEVWCTECEEKLCKPCRIFHERSKASAKHRLVSISGNVSEFHHITVNEICHQHIGKQLDVYCVDHSTMCCSVCVSVSHRHCNNVKPIEEVINKTIAGQSYSKAEWTELAEETRKMLDDDDLGMTLLNSNEKEESAEMTNRIDKAKDKLDKLNSTFQSELADKCKAHRKQLSVRRMCVNRFYTNAESSHRLMSHLDQQMSERHQFFIREQITNQIAGHYRRMDQNTKKQPNRFDITCKLRTVIDEIIKVPTLGNVDVTTSISEVSQNANVCIGTLVRTLLSTPSVTTFADSTSISDLTGSLQHLTVHTTPVTAAVDVWAGDVACVQTIHSSTLGRIIMPFLFGGIFTDNKEVLIADRNNDRLLLFDDTYSYLKEYKVDGSPTDIARGRTADEVFVAVNENHLLRCTLRNGQLSVINKISSPRGTFAIAVLGDNILVGTNDSVKVMSENGKVNKSIKKSGYNTHLVVSTSKATVYHKDNNDVVCRRLDSDAEVYRYRDAGLKYPVGIGLDRDDNVYVCGYNSGKVFLVSPDGSRWRVLLPKLSAITNPWYIVVHPTKQEFVVTSRAETTSLEVYTFNDNNI